ncbi:hypothetical protein GCM10025734_71860 [Kitasatospora paranensis]
MTAIPRRHREGLALAASAGGAMVVALDGTVLLVAQPALRRDLGAGLAEVQWTSTGYLLAVAALLVIAGRLGDRHGHRRLLVAGVLGFGAASAGIALAPDVGRVIALRVVQGLFGALLQPATLALLRLAHPADRLAGAVAVRTGAIAVAAGSGPVLGGLLVAHLGWRSVFWINVPAAAVIAVLALAVRLPEPTRRPDRRLDLAGAALLAASSALLVHTLAGVPAHGWTSVPTLRGLGAVAALTAGLVAHERRTPDAFVPRAVARSRAVAASMALLLALGAGLFGTLFTATFLLQDSLGLGPWPPGCASCRSPPSWWSAPRPPERRCAGTDRAAPRSPAPDWWCWASSGCRRPPRTAHGRRPAPPSPCWAPGSPR